MKETDKKCLEFNRIVGLWLTHNGGGGDYYHVTTPDNSDVGRDMPADENWSSRSDLIFRKHTHTTVTTRRVDKSESS